MTREELQAIWQAATGLRFAPGSATERGLIAVLDKVEDKVLESDGTPFGITVAIRFTQDRN